jgi:hypothetical protein
VRRALPFVAIAVVCGFLLGCGGAKGPPDTWSQTGETIHASWTVPSESSINLQLTRAVSMISCTTRSKGKSEPGTMLIIGGFPAAHFPIGTTLQPGARVRTTCQVTGTVIDLSYGGAPFKHLEKKT